MLYTIFCVVLSDYRRQDVLSRLIRFRVGRLSPGYIFYLKYGRGIGFWTGQPFRTRVQARGTGIPDPDPASVAAPDATDDDDVDRALPSAPMVQRTSASARVDLTPDAVRFYPSLK